MALSHEFPQGTVEPQPPLNWTEQMELVHKLTGPFDGDFSPKRLPHNGSHTEAQDALSLLERDAGMPEEGSFPEDWGALGTN